MKTSHLKLALASLVLVFVFSGCWSNNAGGCGKSHLSQKEADHLLLGYVADDLNAKQTNWTVIVVPRTNPPAEPGALYQMFQPRPDDAPPRTDPRRLPSPSDTPK